MDVKSEGDGDAANMMLPSKGESTILSVTAVPVGDGDGSTLILPVAIALFCIGH